MKDSIIDSTASYSTCWIILAMNNIDWVALGAAILLVTRLLKDIPECYDSLKERINSFKNRNKKNGKNSINKK